MDKPPPHHSWVAPASRQCPNWWQTPQCRLSPTSPRPHVPSTVTHPLLHHHHPPQPRIRGQGPPTAAGACQPSRVTMPALAQCRGHRGGNGPARGGCGRFWGWQSGDSVAGAGKEPQEALSWGVTLCHPSSVSPGLCQARGLLSRVQAGFASPEQALWSWHQLGSVTVIGVRGWAGTRYIRG